MNDSLLERLRPIAQIIVDRDAAIAQIDREANLQLAAILGIVGTVAAAMDCAAAAIDAGTVLALAAAVPDAETGSSPKKASTSKKNQCVDCGVPCIKERCHKHAAAHSWAVRREGKQVPMAVPLPSSSVLIPPAVIAAITTAKRDSDFLTAGFSLVVDSQTGVYSARRLDRILMRTERAIAHFNYIESANHWVVQRPPLTSADPRMLDALLKH